MALSIGGRSGDDYGIDDFVGLGERLAVPERAVRRAVADLVNRSDGWLADLDQLPFDRGQIAKLRRVIIHRRDRLSGGASSH
jgi:serine/threonine-protein kinase HipA